jgi:hypothetical protein
MLVNVFVTMFVCAYLAIAIYGHVLMVNALWPNLFRRRGIGPIIRVGERRIPQRR